MSAFGLRRLAGLVADGAAVDRVASDTTLPASQRSAIGILGRMSQSARQDALDLDADGRNAVDVIGAAVALVAALQVGLALMALATDTPGGSAGRVPRGLQATTMALNLAAAVVLAGIAGQNRAARALAMVFVGIAGAFAGPLAATPPAWVPLALELSWSSALRLPGDLALLVGTWSFVTHFPRVEAGVAAQHALSGLSRIAAVAAAAIFGAHVWLELGGRAGAGKLSRLDRHAPESQYWSIVFLLTALAAPFAVRKLQLGFSRDRRPVQLFLAGLAVGLAPVAVLSIAGTLSAPAAAFLRRGDVFPLATAVVFAGLWTLPFTTAAATMARGALPLRFVVRRSLQYAVTRHALSVAIGLPLVAAALTLAAHPHETIGQFITGRGLIWLTTAACGVVAALFRRRLLAAIDRLFRLDAVDPRTLIAQVSVASRRKPSARDAGGSLVAAVRTAFHPRDAALLVAMPAGAFVPMVGVSESLPTASALAGVVQASPNALSFAGTPDSVARLLPASDRAWATRQHWQVLVPLHAEGETLGGILCLGPRTSADAYSADDLATLEALCSALGTLIAARVAGADAGAAGNRVGTECERCGRLFDLAALACPCGGHVVGSLLPPTVAGRYTLRRRLGRGAMGVVYRATEEALGRDVALKTLPEVGPSEARQLRAEARIMASLHHPGLAFVVGLETVGPLPVLVVEYLAAGTLADRLRRGPLDAPDAVALGLGLSEALDYLHRMGVLHRDLKPANVGYTPSGHPKLLDFGVAVPLATTAGGAQAGTLLYMPPQAFAGEPPSPLFDLWSLGVLLCEARIGRHPLADLSLGEQMTVLESGDVWAHAARRMPSASDPLAAVLARILSLAAGDRYADARQVRLALEHARSDP